MSDRLSQALRSGISVRDDRRKAADEVFEIIGQYLDALVSRDDKAEEILHDNGMAIVRRIKVQPCKAVSRHHSEARRAIARKRK